MNNEGPDFASKALKSLQEPGSALSGLKAEILIKKHNRSNTEQLGQYLKENIKTEAIIAISSEGGLFDYCSDDLLFSNLKEIYSSTPDNVLLAGTLSRQDDIGKRFNTVSNATIDRNIEEFDFLVNKCGWSIDKSFIEPLSLVFRMKKTTN